MDVYNIQHNVFGVLMCITNVVSFIKKKKKKQTNKWQEHFHIKQEKEKTLKKNKK